MKLLMACVAALSLFGCAEDPTSNGGENLAGVRPAKPNIQDPTATGQPANPQIFEGMNGKQNVPGQGLGDLTVNDGSFSETIKPQGPVPGVCDDCEVIAIHVPSRPSLGDAAIEDVNMVSSDGTYLCHQQLSDGAILVNDCNWLR